MEQQEYALADKGPVADAVAWSSGTGRPRLPMPADATDCHHHIYDPRYPWTREATSTPGPALVGDYRQLQGRLGTSRNVIVQPSSYGTDNRLLLASLAEFGEQARGVAVADPGITGEQLQRLHRGGVRGLRFNVLPPVTITLDMILPLAGRIAAMGWHIQVNAPATDLLATCDLWRALPCPVVFDHLAHIPQPDGLHHPAFDLVGELLAAGKAYVKLSGLYNDTRIGPPGYDDSVAIAAAYAAAAPGQVLWGSDWPHPTEQPSGLIPDDALMLDLLGVAVPDAALRTRILVDNPARLYQF